MRTMRVAMVLATLAVAFGLMAPQAYGHSGSGAQGGAAFSVPPDVRSIFNRHCVSCHGGSSPDAGHDFTTDADLKKLVGMKSSEKSSIPMIDPGKPDHSYLVMKIKGGSGISGSRMPLGRSPLSDQQIKAISDWIAGMPPSGDAPKSAPADTSKVKPAPADTSGTKPGGVMKSMSSSAEKTSGAGADPDKPAADRMFDGAYLYRMSCEDCHGVQGEGVTLFGPPLAGNAFVTVSAPEAVGEVIQMGRKYEHKEYPEYMGMPRFQFITGGELGALLDFLSGPLQGGGK